MAISNFAELSAAIASFAWRTDDSEFEVAIPQFIALAENVINNGAAGIAPLRVREMHASATITITDGSGPLPADYLEFREVRDSSNPVRVLQAVDPNWADEAYPLGDGGLASFFSITGSTLTTYPKSSSNLVLSYYEKVPALTVDDDTNWLLTKSPNAYLYGALSHAELFSRDEQRGNMFNQMFAAALQGLREANEMSLYARATARVRGATP